MAAVGVIGFATALVVVVGPLALWLAGYARGPRLEQAPSVRWDWKLTVMSALLYVLAFNLTFFIQELFLVLPKALTPGLRPTLFHNNHGWEGINPLASLFQGTGAMATLASGSFCALLLRRCLGRSAASRLFLFWMGYSGLFMALPQIVIGAISDQSDLGMFMRYLGLGANIKTVLALIALTLIPIAAGWLGSLLPGQGPRQQFLFRVATLPALLALPVILLFRIPREWIEVLMVPVVVSFIGLAWIQAGAWRAEPAADRPSATAVSLAWPLGMVLGLLLLFQLLLRPGIRFY
ncbi:hypothetical protein SAMN05518865_105255 [Duganella sp. CF458]|uniref:hypothetical protein n=1 Tax=Duganella sp. CF458 TaxID=1884368 RepID=UPI0008EDB202|nr:hypothetical protein [Duganella sp. CF458]SFF86764.1 hypothetical protein SAMN05518865_105255 [Duganella sp. CF458]